MDTGFPDNTNGCFINHNINAFNNLLKSIIVVFISFSSRGVSKEISLINSSFKLSNFIIIILYVTFASKDFEVFYSRRLTIPKFMRSLSVVYPDVFFVENSNGSKCNFTQKVAGVPYSSSIAQAIC